MLGHAARDNLDWVARKDLGRDRVPCGTEALCRAVQLLTQARFIAPGMDEPAFEIGKRGCASDVLDGFSDTWAIFVGDHEPPDGFKGS